MSHNQKTPYYLSKWQTHCEYVFINENIYFYTYSNNVLYTNFIYVDNNFFTTTSTAN